MAANEVYNDADSLVLPVASTVVSGAPVIVGSLVGVALVKATIGEDGNYYTTVKFEGVFRLTVTGTLAVGAPVYITSAGALNVTASGNTLFGYAIKPKAASGAGEAFVKIAAK